MATSTVSELVMLRGGCSVSVDALRLLWGLENRGLDIRVSHDGALLVGPRAQVTDADRDFIRQHRNELLTLLAYVPWVD